MKKHVSLVLKLCSLGLIIFAGNLWAGAGVVSRPKYKDEQTLVGGTIWSQSIIPIGLLITNILQQELDIFVQGYFLLTGSVLNITTALFLIIRECLVVTRHRRAVIENIHLNNQLFHRNLKFDKVYFSIGVLCLVAGFITFVDFLVTIA